MTEILHHTEESCEESHEVSQEALAAACGVTWKTVKAALKALAIRRLVSVKQEGSKSHATRYRVHVAREAGIRR